MTWQDDVGLSIEEGGRPQLEAEVERLRWELAGLASSLNGLRELRLMRLFDRYRLLRHRLEDAWLRIRPRRPRPRATGPTDLAPTAGPYDVLLFSGADWSWRFQRPQQLATQWAEHGHRVFFFAPDFSPHVNPLWSRPPRPYCANLVRPNILEVHLAGPREMQPLSKRMLPDDARALLDAFLALQHDYQLERCACVLEFPFWTPLALQLRTHWEWPVVYDYMDRYYGVFSTAHSVLADEITLLREADLVVATARLLCEDAAPFNYNIRYIPNGADIAHFDQKPAKNPLHALGIERPIVGYYGSLAHWFDIDLVYRTAAEHPEWRFVLIGSGPADLRRLAQLPNVHLLGEKPYADLPAYLHHFDVAIIPFKLLPVTAATDPVKLYEYMAAGKPVVATALPELQPHAEMVYLCNGPDDLGTQIALALTEDSAGRQEQRKEWARHSCWEERFQDYHRAVLQLLERPARVSPSEKRAAPPAPFLSAIAPAVVRVAAASHLPAAVSRELVVQGHGFHERCVVLIDEQAMPTRLVHAAELICQVPAALYRTPGCRMVSVIDQQTWRQSNRRVLLVEGV